MSILNLDVSLTNTGVAILSHRCGEWVITDTGDIRTASEYKKKKIYKTDDTIRRVRHIATELNKYCAVGEIDLIVAELPVGGGQSSSAAEGMGIAKAVVATFHAITKIPLLNVTPDDVKRAATGVKNASKEQVQEAIVKRWPELGKQYYSKRAKSGFKGEFEHIADALGAFMAVEHDPAVAAVQMLDKTRNVDAFAGVDPFAL